MKKVFFIAFIGFSAMAFAQEETKKFAPPAGNALVGDSYGNGVSEIDKTKAVSTKKLSKKLKKSQKLENVSVKGKVLEVCPKKGCWITVENNENEKFFVKMKDYAFFVPTALIGKTVVLNGNAEVKEISVEEAKHYAEDAKKSEAEIDAITAPQKEIRFLASGIEVVN
ncbi:MAG: DUF4920 domain-containing protein [Cruoricaptor ignavus]|nr:DUF4920 domain-containing protein [Cruoricaptor ignavus]